MKNKQFLLNKITLLDLLYIKINAMNGVIGAWGGVIMEICMRHMFAAGMVVEICNDLMHMMVCEQLEPTMIQFVVVGQGVEEQNVVNLKTDEC